MTQAINAPGIDVVELEKTYLLGKTTPRNVGVGRYLIEMVLVLTGMLLPALLVYLSTAEGETYDIFSVKAPGYSVSMEFIRVSVFMAALYAAYLVTVMAVKLLPGLIIAIFEMGQRNVCFPARRHLHYAGKVNKLIALALFSALVAVISANIIYDSSFLDHVGQSLQSTIVASEATTIVERLFVVLVCFAGLLALSQYVVAAIAYNFYRAAYAVRIDLANRKYDILERLFLSLSRGIPSQAPRPHKHYSSSVALEGDRGMDLSSAKRSTEVADELFHKLSAENRDYLTEDDFRLYFDRADAKHAFATFDATATGRVTRDDFRSTVYSIYEERHYIQRSLESTKKIVHKVRLVFALIAGVLTLLFGVALFKLQTTGIFIVLGVLYGAFTYIAQDGMRGVYESLLFIFNEHAFDVGDKVIISGENLVVDQIELFTTIFRKWDNTAVYIPNTVLSHKAIYNVRRSGNTLERVEVTIPTAASMDQLWALRDGLAKWCLSMPRDFTEYADIASFDALDSKSTKVELIVECLASVQDTAHRARRRKALDAQVRQVQSELGLTLETS